MDAPLRGAGLDTSFVAWLRRSVLGGGFVSKAEAQDDDAVGALRTGKLAF